MIWVSWPKRAARLPTTLTEDVVRALALALGLVDVKVCAVDAVWSGLKLVIPRALRGRGGCGHANEDRTIRPGASRRFLGMARAGAAV